jgi:valyl-tRNA synthetase
MSESVCIDNGNVEGQENESGNGEGPPKTARHLEKEAKKLAKLERFQQKKDKLKETPVHTMEKVEVCSTITRNKSCTIW